MNRAAQPLVSVVVPVLADSEPLRELLASFAAGPAGELIISNGAASDPAVAALHARHPEARWTDTAPGRGRQMNAGAAVARGRWLLFLHADGRLAPGWLDAIRRIDADERSVWGSFRFTLDSPAWAARLIEWGVAQRVQWLGLPYGDQALFVRRDVFESLGGYRELPLMEDVDLVRRLRRAGPLAHLAVPVRISPRRWERDGWARRSIENVALVLLFFAGVSPERLARIYYRRDRPRGTAAPPRFQESPTHEPDYRPQPE